MNFLKLLTRPSRPQRYVQAAVGLAAIDALAESHLGPLKFIAVIALLTLPGSGILSFTPRRRINERALRVGVQVGLSLLSIMIMGLIVNGLIQLFELSSHGTDIVSVIGMDLLLLPGLYHLRLPERAVTLDRLRAYWPLATTSTVLLAVVTAGAVRLNNGTSATVSIVGAILICCYLIFFGLWTTAKERRGAAFALFVAALSICLEVWLRGAHVLGVDTDREFGLYNYILQAGHWSPLLYQNAYNACLSITVLPQMLHMMLSLNGTFVFKFLLPAVCCLTPAILYTTVRRVAPKRLAFLAATFYLIQPVIFSGFLLPIRQQVAFFFFALFVSVLLCNQLSPRLRGSLLYLMGAGIILSHYSTAYIFVGLLLLLYVFTLGAKNRPVHINLKAVAAFMLLTFFWYSQFGTGFNGATDYLRGSLANISHSFSADSQNQGASFGDNFEVLTGPQPKLSTVRNYYTSLQHSSKNAKLLPYPHATTVSAPASRGNKTAVRVIKFASNGLTFVIPFLAIIGIFALRPELRHRIRPHEESLILGAAASAVTIYLLFLVMPYISVNYDLNRLHQQLLIVLAPFVIAGVSYFDRYLFRRGILPWLYIAAFFVVASGLVQQALGGQDVSLSFNNNGINYAMYYTGSGDATGAEWLAEHTSLYQSLSADPYASDKLSMYLPPDEIGKINTNIIESYTKQTTLFVSSANNSQQVALTPFKGPTIVYQFPTASLQQTQDTTYTNGSSEIYTPQ